MLRTRRRVPHITIVMLRNTWAVCVGSRGRRVLQSYCCENRGEKKKKRTGACSQSSSKLHLKNFWVPSAISVFNGDFEHTKCACTNAFYVWVSTVICHNRMNSVLYSVMCVHSHHREATVQRPSFWMQNSSWHFCSTCPRNIRLCQTETEWDLFLKFLP